MCKRSILVNASILDEKPTGLGVYTKNIINQIKGIEGVRVFAPISIEGAQSHKVLKYTKPSYKIKGGIVRFLWTQLVLPFKAERGEIIYHPFQYLSLFSRNKQIITIHDFIPLYYPKIAKHQHLYYKFIMPILLKKAYKIICISENTKKDILKFYDVEQDKIKVIHNGFDSNLYNGKNVDDYIIEKFQINYEYLIMVGAGYSHKNIEVAIQAIQECDNTDFKVLIVGKESDYIKKIKEIVKEKKLEERVIFLGYVTDNELVGLYKNSKAFIYTTLYEGFGLPILEAMGAGTVVISANNSSLPEVYGEAALNFDAQNSSQLAKCIDELLENENLRNELLIKSKQQIQKFSWIKTSNEILSVLK